MNTDRQVMELTHQVELLRVQLAAAQQVAAERDRLIETQAQALRALEAPRADEVPAPEPAPAPQPQPAPQPERRRGLRGLLGF